MARSRLDFFAILQTLSDHDVDFIIVGGVCAVLHGAPISTFDLDLVHSRRHENVDRLLASLGKLEARYRNHAGRNITPLRSHLLSPGHHLLMTRAGPLDLLGEIEESRGYEELAGHTVTMKLSEDLEVRVLDLETLISLRKYSRREKDRAVLAVLERTLQEKNRHRK